MVSLLVCVYWGLVNPKTISGVRYNYIYYKHQDSKTFHLEEYSLLLLQTNIFMFSYIVYCTQIFSCFHKLCIANNYFHVLIIHVLQTNIFLFSIFIIHVLLQNTSSNNKLVFPGVSHPGDDQTQPCFASEGNRSWAAGCYS